MFGRKNQHRFVKNRHIIERPLFCTLPLVMNDSGAGKIMILPPSFNNSPAEIDIFPVHEKVFIQDTYFIQSRFTHPHKRTT